MQSLNSANVGRISLYFCTLFVEFTKPTFRQSKPRLALKTRFRMTGFLHWVWLLARMSTTFTINRRIQARTRSRTTATRVETRNIGNYSGSRVGRTIKT